jgi:Tfp pilus assembly protein PilV
MVKLKYKLKAFSIIESMVSMVIVVIVFSLSTMAIANVTTTGMSKEKQDAYMLVKQMRNITLKSERFIDESVEEKGLIIQKTILNYNRSEDLRVLLIEALKDEKKLFESREIILIKTE